MIAPVAETKAHFAPGPAGPVAPAGPASPFAPAGPGRPRNPRGPRKPRGPRGPRVFGLAFALVFTLAVLTVEPRRETAAQLVPPRATIRAIEATTIAGEGTR